MSKKAVSPKQKKRKTQKSTRQSRFGLGLSNAKVSTILMWVLALFMALLVMVGALGAWYASKSLDLMRTINEQDQRTSEIMDLSHDMMVARINLLTAARLLEEADAQQDFSLRERALDTVNLSVAVLDGVRDRFAAFRDVQSNDAEFSRLQSQLYRRFQQYMGDGVEPMVDALSAEDYDTFYYVNAEYGVAGAEAFQRAVGALSADLEDTQAWLYDQAEAAYKQALVVIAASVVLGLILIIIMRLVFQRVVVRRLNEAQAHFDHIASGDLTRRIDVGSRNEIGVLYEALRRMQDGLARVVSEVRASVEEITVGAREIYMGNTDLSTRTEQQAAALQETAASMEELDSTVRQNTDNATEADKLAANAAEVASRGGEAVSAVVSTMRDISDQSEQMSEIVSAIDGIAFQTNILALNAAVEAARAGEQGRGFAVVASEVRSLAQRSAQAAREIKQLIDDSMVKIREGAGRADEAGRVMEEVVDAIHGVSVIMAEISSASHEQADGIGQVNVAITQMDSVVQQNASLVEEAAAAAGSLQSQAARLQSAVARFRLAASDVIDIHAQEQRQLGQHATSGDEADDDDTGAPRTTSPGLLSA